MRGVIGAIRQHDLRRQASDERGGLGHIAMVAGGEAKATGLTSPHGHVDPGAQTAAGTAKDLIFSPFQRRSRAGERDDDAVDDQILEVTVVSHGGEDAVPDALGAPPAEPRNALLQGPNTSGRSRHGELVRTIHNTASTNIRLSRPDAACPLIADDVP